jgi:hypothetical protein
MMSRSKFWWALSVSVIAYLFFGNTKEIVWHRFAYGKPSNDFSCGSREPYQIEDARRVMDVLVPNDCTAHKR